MKLSHVDVAGTRIAVRESDGAGSPVVLIHGNSCSARAFDKQFAGPLARQHRLIAFDFPGHGESARAAGYSFPQFIRTLLEVARSRGAEKGVFVGWSLGGHVLLDAADQLPEAAGFLIYGAPPLGSPPAMDKAFLPHPAISELWLENLTDEQTIRRVDACLRPGVEPPQEFIDAIRQSDPKMRPALLASLGAGHLADEVRIVRELKRPLGVLHGAEEQVVNGDYYQSLVMPTLWRGAVQVVAGAGHSPQWETPAAFDALVDDFATEVSSPFAERTASC